MIFEKNYIPQFRDADRDGRVGLRGYMNYFQDMATHYMHNIQKGNDTLPEEYGIVWMYTKYKMHINRKIDFSGELNMKTWIPEGKSPAVVRQNLLISRSGEACAWGCVESCLYDISKKRLARLKEIDFPANIAESGPAATGTEPDRQGFQKLPADLEGMEAVYTHQVRYTDLDKTGHMTNLKYVDLFLNAFDSRFFEGFQIKEFELHFLDQCFEGDAIHVHKKAFDGRILLTAVHDDQVPCAVACIAGEAASI
ncbi:MAG: hypothetical protein K2O40_11760 [Lachnospiraceae bacterium]|nr:hypothetical protein [Lachnospiraceae bacterium]